MGTKLEEINFDDGKFTDQSGKPLDVVPVRPPRIIITKSKGELFFNAALDTSLKFEDAGAKYFLRGGSKEFFHEMSRFNNMTIYYHPIQLYKHSQSTFR